ncbi:rap GTPase-activating protein, putative [Entamoeba invadens IP1]|uniref:Rap GTPase-activating protein, putative n=1 Tax=Entamoeba invadens IP1 TaxID=370355 RepID=A0A0A1TUV7_ENTIV|nr:rap GTPase-activating protein, putative [Entamoeba invadens IP1]ELP83960.1 rap GTPase-activating protein, putative [Entamoeba invadens IP1]|eukprot:XP_004183306.1 rap GTPase-activating protein, putative [Entamoeba invadens IP1]
MEEECSPAFFKFMALIGNKTELLGYSNYREGLDVKMGTTRKYSYTNFTYQFNIMFHVALLLKLLEEEQVLERKRHVGNDVVVLVSKKQVDENEQFDSRILTFHLNSLLLVFYYKNRKRQISAFVVISLMKRTEDNTQYRIMTCTKPSNDAFQPFENEIRIYQHRDELKDLKNLLMEKICHCSHLHSELITERPLRNN